MIFAKIRGSFLKRKGAKKRGNKKKGFNTESAGVAGKRRVQPQYNTRNCGIALNLHTMGWKQNNESYYDVSSFETANRLESFKT
jgi:hypothetical protein